MLGKEEDNQMIEDQDINCVLIEKLRGITNKISGNFPKEVDSKKKIMSSCLSHLTKALEIKEEDLENSEFNNIEIDDRKKIVEAFKSHLNSPEDLVMIMCVLANKKIKNMEEMEMKKMEMKKMGEKNKNVFERLSTTPTQRGGNDDDGESIINFGSIVAHSLLSTLVTPVKVVGGLTIEITLFACIVIKFFTYDITKALIEHKVLEARRNRATGGGVKNYNCDKIKNIYESLNPDTKKLLEENNNKVKDGLTNIDNNFDEKFNKLKNVEEVEEQPVKQQVEEPVKKPPVEPSVFDTGDKLLNYTFGGRRSRSKRNKRVKGGFTKKKGGKKKSNKKRVINVTKGGRRKLSKTRRNVRSKK